MHRQFSRFCALLTTFALAAIAASQAQFKTLFVVNNVGGTVSSWRVNADGTLTLIGNYPAGTNPQDCGVTKDGRNLIVVNATQQTSEELYTFVINSDGSLTQINLPILVADGPLSLTVLPTGVAVVPSAAADTISTFRIQSDTTLPVNTIAAGDFPVKVAPSLDGKLVFLCGGIGSYYVKSLGVQPDGTIYDLGTTQTITNGSTQGLALHPSGRYLFVSTALGQVVRSYSVSPTGALAFLNQASNGGNSCVELAIHPEGRLLFVCNVVSDTLTVLPVLEDGTLANSTQSYTIGNDIRDVITDGRYVFVTDESTLGGSPRGVRCYRLESFGTLTDLGIFDSGQGRPQHMALWIPMSDVPPVQFQITRGILAGGGLDSLLASDEDKLIVRQGIRLSPSDPPVQIVVEGIAPSADISRLTFECEAMTNAIPPSNVVQTIELYDFFFDRWTTVDSGPASGVDRLIEAHRTLVPSNFVQGGTNRVRARVSWRQSGITANVWEVRIDKLAWRTSTP